MTLNFQRVCDWGMNSRLIVRLYFGKIRVGRSWTPFPHCCYFSDHPGASLGTPGLRVNISEQSGFETCVPGIRLSLKSVSWIPQALDSDSVLFLEEDLLQWGKLQIGSYGFQK